MNILLVKNRVWCSVVMYNYRVLLITKILFCLACVDCVAECNLISLRLGKVKSKSKSRIGDDTY